MKILVSSLCLIMLGLSLIACSPKVGSEAWCADMKEKPKKEWTANELKDFTKHCLFK